VYSPVSIIERLYKQNSKLWVYLLTYSNVYFQNKVVLRYQRKVQTAYTVPRWCIRLLRRLTGGIVLLSYTLGRLIEQMKARDIIFYIRALTAIILAEHFRLGSTMEKISDNFIPYLLSIITTVLLKL
jgi:hypothetical protein